MKNTAPLIMSTASALILALGGTLVAAPTATPGLKAPSPGSAAITKQNGSANVTSAGFEKLIAETTLYMEIPIEGTVGQDCTPDSVKKSLEIAAEDPNIQHVVFMVDVEPHPVQGALLDKNVVDAFPGKLKIHSVVRTGLNFAVFPIFSSDTIYMTEDAVIGGMAIHYFMPPGSTEVTAKWVGIVSSQLATAAQSHGHNPDIARAMVDSKEKLYYWRENGEVKISNDRPVNADSVQSLEQIESVMFGDTLTLNQEAAIRIQLAQPIDDYDAWSIGEKLNIEKWESANHFAQCAHQIGGILAELQPEIEYVKEIDKQIPEPSRDSPDYREEREIKQAVSQVVTGMKQVEEGLLTIMDRHPERHAYFTGEGGQTILADAAKWQEDVDICARELGRIRSGLSQIRAAMIKFYADPDRINFLTVELDKIKVHLDGIQQHGNAKYWNEFAVPDLPPDIYG